VWHGDDKGCVSRGEGALQPNWHTVGMPTRSPQAVPLTAVASAGQERDFNQRQLGTVTSRLPLPLPLAPSVVRAAAATVLNVGARVEPEADNGE
jgi:hypothetical protein